MPSELTGGGMWCRCALAAQVGGIGGGCGALSSPTALRVALRGGRSGALGPQEGGEACAPSLGFAQTRQPINSRCDAPATSATSPGLKDNYNARFRL
jgi:hypothetical protein